jgi:hypothetical protein
MSTRRQRRAAARLAKVAQGPVTPEPGRNQPSHAADALRAGLAIPFTSRLSNTVVLTIESHEEFNALHELYCDEHHPATPGEHLIIEEMTVARWRLQRSWLTETYLIENQMDRMTGEIEQTYQTMDNGTRLSLAFRGLAEQSPALALIQRQINSLTRQLDQCVKRLENFAAQGSQLTGNKASYQMYQTTPIPISNTIKLPLNLSGRPGRQPLHEVQNPSDLKTRPLRAHPKWSYFLRDLNDMILTHYPAVEEPFHELLKRSDQLY